MHEGESMYSKYHTRTDVYHTKGRKALGQILVYVMGQTVLDYYAFKLMFSHLADAFNQRNVQVRNTCNLSISVLPKDTST